MYSEAKAGLFRANSEAVSPNNIRLVDPETPGTAAQDNGTITYVAASIFQGIRYTGKDGINRYIPFFRVETPTGVNVPIEVPSEGNGGGAVGKLYDAIRAAVELNEVDPVLTLTYDGPGEILIRHVGAGTIVAVVVSGVNVTLTRTAL